MNRLQETLRDPKWIAIGFTALVLIGSAWKFLATVQEEPAARDAEASASVETIDIEPGTYQLLTSSWRSDAVGASGQGNAGPRVDLSFVPILSPEEEARRKQAHKLWSGICIAVQGQ